MLNYLQKYNNLPQELRDKMSTSEAMGVIEELEKKYGLNLAAVIMKIMIKEMAVNNLAVNLSNEFSVNTEKAEQLASDLKEKILFRAADYLGIKIKPKEAGPMIELPDITESEKKSPVQSIDSLFSREDEEKIKSLAQKANMDIKESELSDNIIEEKLNKAVAEAHINFGSDLLLERFKQILKTYFRGIRNRISAKQTLIKSIELGGLGFDGDSAEKVLKIADSNIKNSNKTAQNIKPLERIKTPDLEKETLTSLQASGVRDIDYDLSALKKFPDNGIDNIQHPAEVKKIINKLDTKHELAPPPPAIKPIEPHGKDSILQKDQKKKLFLPKIKNILSRKAPDKIIAEKSGAFAEKRKAIKPEQKISEQKTEEQVHKIKQIDARQADGTMGKIKMDDIKFTPKSMGPIDELKYMDLASFRRLCKTPEEIAGKIKEKINLLEEENYAKRLEGIKAWRKNPVNKVYLEIGNQSINQKQPIMAVIKERKTAGNDYLSNQEFEAITDLNKDLRF